MNTILDLQAILDAIRAARSLTVMGHTAEGLPIIGQVGWDQLQEALKKVEE